MNYFSTLNESLGAPSRTEVDSWDLDRNRLHFCKWNLHGEGVVHGNAPVLINEAAVASPPHTFVHQSRVGVGNVCSVCVDPYKLSCSIFK